MLEIKKKYSALVGQILEEAYVGLRETGEFPAETENYLKGFLDAGLHVDLVTKEELQSLIDETNVRMFGVTQDKRKQLFENLRTSYDDYLDVPTYFRQGRKPSGGQVPPCPE